MHTMDKLPSGAPGSGAPSPPNFTAKSKDLTSPARSDKSDDSEGRPVREKLKETRIDGQSDQAPSADQPMGDAAVNGHPAEASTSGSDNERGRLRRKRSREDFEDEAEDAKPQGKKHERHTRKKSRDFTSPLSSDAEVPAKKSNGFVAPIAEKDEHEDVNLTSATSATDRQVTPEVVMSDKEGEAVTSPKNKRKLEQTTPSSDPAVESSHVTTASSKSDGRDTKRPRDGAVSEPMTKIPAGSGFSNTSAVSPFASVAPKSSTNPTEASAKDAPQTSEQAFKSSGFGSFASSSVSPFAAGKSGASSPFGAAASSKLSSFASRPTASSTTTTSGFASLGGATSSLSSGLGPTKSAFGGALGGSAFGSVLGSKPALSTFGAGGSITGLTEKSTPTFGAAESKAESDDEGDDDGDDNENDDNRDEDDERRTGQPLLATTGPPETGEENEDAQWTGRAKLYAFVSSDGTRDGKKSWQERGKGPLKLNVTRDEPKKGRFVLRADGTHRLLLNVAIMKSMIIGDAEGNGPKDGRLVFAAPTASGEVETLMLSGNATRISELWHQVVALKQ